MKRWAILILLTALCLGLWAPALAASNAAYVGSETAIAPDGSCTVTLTLRMEESDAACEFPIPAEAADVYLGDAPAGIDRRGNQSWVMVSGSSAVIRYSLPCVVTLEKTRALVQLQLLGGFTGRIESMDFVITLPGEITAEPVFSSGYYQAEIAGSITVSVVDNTVSGTLTAPLKDHETLTMELEADKAMFAQMNQRKPLLTAWGWAMLACVAAAAVYYCMTLMPKLTRRTRCNGAPDGITAGELGTCLTACGTDLTMLVISWAQLGYLTIEIDGEDHVTLRKRMDMGNERSRLEVRCFQDLFNRRSRVDGTGLHYAQICRKMAGKSVLLRQLYQPDSGSPQLFRILMTLPAIVSGVQMGIDLGVNGGTKTVFALLLGIICGALCYFIQSGGKCLPLRDKSPLLLCLGCGVLWIALGIVTGHVVTAACMVALQFASGIAAAYGGKRSTLGVHALAQIRGLRYHLRTAKTSELQVQMGKNPDYFYEMAPYALALGLDRKFARSFGKTPLPENSYLDVGTNRPMTASQWAAELRYAADILNKRQKRLHYSETK